MRDTAAEALGLCHMQLRVFLFGQVTWKECLSNNAAWDTLTWFAALIGMASYLNKYGFIKWFSSKVCPWPCWRKPPIGMGPDSPC